jgi:hypothetical protein
VLKKVEIGMPTIVRTASTEARSLAIKRRAIDLGASLVEWRVDDEAPK